MLSYQHIYHAGVNADCHKHLVLSLLLAQLCEKPAPFRYIDLHSGRGVYDFSAPEAQKKQEYKQGIAELWQRPDAPLEAQGYLAAVKKLNGDGMLRFYPGSPMLADLLRRDGDALELYELHPQEFAALEETMGTLQDVFVYRHDGWDTLVSQAAPKENRGLVLIDPSYELKDDYADMAPRLERALKKWRNGIYAVWYPLLQDKRHQVMLDGLRTSSLRKILRSEIIFSDPSKPGMHGSGMLILNPPWQIENRIDKAVNWLARVIGQSAVCDWLIEE